MLPYVKQPAARTQQQLVAFRGLNWSDQAQEGELREGTNLSARRFPCLAVRRGRGRGRDIGGGTGRAGGWALV